MVIAVGAMVHTAWGVVAGPNDVINACAFQDGGGLRMLSGSDGCNPDTETPVSWSHTGPAGPAGPQGPDGAQGAQGVQGVPGRDGAADMLVQEAYAQGPGGFGYQDDNLTKPGQAFTLPLTLRAGGTWILTGSASVWGMRSYRDHRGRLAWTNMQGFCRIVGQGTVVSTPVYVGIGFVDNQGLWMEPLLSGRPTYENATLSRTLTIVPGTSQEVSFQCGIGEQDVLDGDQSHMGMQDMRLLAVRVAPPLRPDRVDVTKVDYDTLIGSRKKVPFRLPRAHEQARVSQREIKAGKAAELKAIRKALKSKRPVPTR